MRFSRTARYAPGTASSPQHWITVVLMLLLITFIVAAPAHAGRLNGGLAGGFAVAPATAPPPMPTQFDVTGFIQEATVALRGSMCPGVTDDRLMGGTVTLNGQKITVPCNTILQMPAATVTWADLFTMGPKDTTPNGTGLALADVVNAASPGVLSTHAYNAALPSHEIQVVGNVMQSGEYIAGLIFISQQGLNGGQGVISCIDYVSGELQVGGPLQVDGAPCPAIQPGVARVRMNDPIGRFGITHGGIGSGADVEEVGYDPRFGADTDNPTMFSTLGFPVCIPRINPFQPTVLPTGTIPAGVDTLCPMSNRPVVPNCKDYDLATGLPSFGGQAAGYCRTFVMDPPGTPAPVGITCPGPGTATLHCPTDPTQQAPLVIGDRIDFHGTLKADAVGPYISAHTIAANLGIYTHPHTKPSYVAMEGVLVGAGGQIINGIAQEGTAKVSWVGFASDPTELVDFYALHQDPVTGAGTEFFLGTENPCCSPLGRFRTPANNLGAFGDPQRMYRAVSRNACQTDGVNPPSTPQVTLLCHIDPLAAPGVALQASYTRSADGLVGNGLVPSTYSLPNFEFIFPENLNFGSPLVPNNLQDLPFLFCGSGPLDGPNSGTTVVGQLDPAPWGLPMADPVFAATLCPTARKVGGGAPSANAGPNQQVPSSSLVHLAGSGIGVPTLSFAWVQTGGPAVVLSNPAIANPTFTAPSVAVRTTLTFRLTVTNGSGSSNSFVTITVNAAAAATVNPIAPKTVVSGTPVTMTATSATAGVTFRWTQTGGSPTVLIPNPKTGASISFTVTLPAGSLTSKVLTFSVTATNSAGATSAPMVTTVTITPPADGVAISAVSYRLQQNKGGALSNVGKLTITATSTANTIANPAPAGMTMTALFSNSSLPASVLGSTANPISTPLTLTIDPVGTLAPICPSANPCWTTLISGVIADTSVTPAVLLPPTSVTVTSSLGGTATATGAAIVVR